MKRDGRCPKCQGERILHIESSRPEEQRMLWRRAERTGILGGTGHVLEGVGRVEAYVCAGCGYLEEYICRPETIPWDDVVGARWVDAKAKREGPYR